MDFEPALPAAAMDGDAPPAVEEARRAEAVSEPPKVRQRKVAASRERWPAFALLMAA